MSYAGAAASAPTQARRSCAHLWGMELRCVRCGMTQQDYTLQYGPLQETGQLRLSWGSDAAVREMVDADVRLATDRAVVKYRRLTLRFADPPPVPPPSPVRAVLSVLPNLLLAWGLIWMRWLLPPEEDE